MRNIQFGLLVFIMIIFAAIQFPQKSLATDWAYQFVVWEGTIYIVSDEHVTDVEEVIGQVTKYSDMKQYGGNFSNTYLKGTKYYSIKGVDPNKAIAVQLDKYVYVKAENDGAYEYNGKGIVNYLLVGLVVVAVTAVGAMVFVNSRGKKK
ncbi:hypothetical protein [Lysinibacillus sp. 3P01SB]|uniref:hypothetical protein n=1 Tax=Lysinibacillus sp. 3P01SB TaxID=3132284 RepID=UPI0039A5B572